MLLYRYLKQTNIYLKQIYLSHSCLTLYWTINVTWFSWAFYLQSLTLWNFRWTLHSVYRRGGAFIPFKFSFVKNQSERKIYLEPFHECKTVDRRFDSRKFKLFLFPSSTWANNEWNPTPFDELAVVSESYSSGLGCSISINVNVTNCNLLIDKTNCVIKVHEP